MTSILDKLKDVVIVDKEFTDQESGEIIEYKAVELTIEFDGDPEVITARLSKSEGKSAYRLITLADIQK